jgi:acetylornithine deacetylase/succinyl-diaminopimelate desuccinylase-like protein
MNTIERAHAHIDANFDTYLKDIKGYLSQPGISQTGEGIRNSAKLTLRLVNGLEDTQARLVEAGGNPVVLGRTRAKVSDPRTLLLYCFYDVVPAAAEDWACPPFQPTVMKAQEIGLPADWGQVLCGRGTTDHRGPFIAALLALRSMQAVDGGLPVDIMYAIEGEEEIGSPNLPAFVKTHRDELGQADAFWFPRTSRETADGPMVVHRGYKGQVWLNLTVKGGEWGGTLDARDIWSANVAWVDAPALRLIKALDSLTDDDYRIAIDGFWDHVRPMTADEKDEIAVLQANFDEDGAKRNLKIARFKGGGSGRELLARYIMEPQLNVSLGVWPGLPGEEDYTKGVVEGRLRTELLMRARARVDFRLTPDLEPDLVIELLRAHLDRRGFHEIEVEKARGSYSWSRTEPTAGVYRALRKACESHGIRPDVWPTMPSTAPFDLFNRSPLQIPIIIFGAAHGARWHEANEYVTVQGLRDFMKLTVSWLHAWAEEPQA